MAKPRLQTKGEEEHPEDHFHAGINHQKGVLEETGPSLLVFDLDACYCHSMRC